jgi:DNA-binding CsgD family transcriptional regulator
MLVDDIPLERFIEAVKKVKNKTDLEYELYKSRKTGRLSLLMSRIARDMIDVSHWTGRYVNKNTAEGRMKGSLHIDSGRLKEYLVRNELLQEKCSVCGLPPTWQGRHLTLHLDHIDGDRKNHSVSNLRLLCPNCHQQTETWGAKRTSKLPNDDKMIEHLREGLRYDEIASLYKVSPSTVSHRLRRMRFKYAAKSLNELLTKL